MSVNTDVENAAVLSDEDFLNQLGNPSFLASEEEQEEELESEKEEEESNPESEELEGQEEEEVEGEGNSDEGEEQEEEEQNPNSEEEGEDDPNKEGEEEEAELSEAELFHQTITKPFKANGKDISVKTPDEAIKLMQMGAGYAKRMSELKPNLQVIKTLDKAKLLDHDSINFMVDLMSGDKNAIMKLLHESKFDIDAVEDLESQSQNYTKSNKIVSAEAVDLDEVIASGRDDEDFSAIMQDVKQWDDSALTKMASEPQVLSHLTQHRKKGIYNTVVSEVTRLRALNDAAIAGKDDLDAYIYVGDMLDRQGAFSNENQPAGKSNANAQAVKDAVKTAIEKRKPKKPAPNKQSAANVKGTQGKRPIKKVSDEDLAALDDEAFMKQLGL